jgi:hypothetical protein
MAGPTAPGRSREGPTRDATGQHSARGAPASRQARRPEPKRQGPDLKPPRHPRVPPAPERVAGPEPAAGPVSLAARLQDPEPPTYRGCRRGPQGPSRPMSRCCRPSLLKWRRRRRLQLSQKAPARRIRRRRPESPAGLGGARATGLMLGPLRTPHFPASSTIAYRVSPAPRCSPECGQNMPRLPALKRRIYAAEGTVSGSHSRSSHPAAHAPRQRAAWCSPSLPAA